MFENQKDKMRSFANELAFKAIEAHMQNDSFIFKNSPYYKIAIYSNKYKLLYGEEIKDIEFLKNTYIKAKSLFLVDKSAQNHLGIKYIVLKDENIFKEIQKLQYKVIFYTLIIILFISIIAYFLAKLFLKPIANEREKLDKFIKDTTHELNTPISALLMSISMLKESDIKIKQRIKISATRISNIYDDLCYLLLNDVNKNLEIKNLNIKDSLNEQILLFEAYAKSKKIQMQIKDLEDLHFLMDEQSIQRLLSNLISNALKYSKPNSIIEISLQNKILKIKDYGQGINKKDLKNIKDRYFRANNTEGGFGIGLDIVNTICKKYHIIFDIKSQKEKGTIISLFFP